MGFGDSGICLFEAKEMWVVCLEKSKNS